MVDSCPICREIHGPDRGLSFDGRGINSCGMYRARLATFVNPASAELGPLFAAAPRMLAALLAVDAAARIVEADNYDDRDMWTAIYQAREIIAAAQSPAYDSKGS